MVVAITLELDGLSCKYIHALRARYQQPPLFVVSLLRNFTYCQTNLDLFARKLPQLASKQAPFEIKLSNLHRAARAKHAVKYSLESPDLRALRDQARKEFGDAYVLQESYEYPFRKENKVSNIIRVTEDFAKHPHAYTKTFNIPVRSRINDQAEAIRILEELRKIDTSRDLGRIKAIGLRLQWQSDHDTARGRYEKGELHLFRGKS